MKPLCVDLFCGTLAWSAGWLELGGRVVGFDIEHLPHHGPVPAGAELVLQDVLTLSGAQFKDASLILCSPPCTEFSFMAMPWSRAKQIARALRGEDEFPSGYRGSRTVKDLTALFDCCFRIQAEASAAAGHHIPLIVENVKGAQPWVGRAKARFGSFYFWGSVEDVGGKIVAAGRPVFGAEMVAAERRIKRPGRNFHAFENGLGSSPSFNGGEHETRHVKVPGLPHGGFPGGGLAQGAIDGIKQPGHSGRARFADPDVAGHLSSKSPARKAASAMIARIPLALSRWVAQCFMPIQNS